MKDLKLTIDRTQDDLVGKKYSCMEMVEGYLARIEKVDPSLNCFLTVSGEKAREGARRTDKAIAEFGKEELLEKFPLLGVTVCAKDLFLTEGIRTTAGSKVLESFVPQYSASAIRKLEDAGCIILGKTNCDAWAHGASGENSDFGPTKNPWDTDYVPGGSSSGSAAAVAAGLSLASTGTDTGGSVRQPASLSGVVGLKPTYGAVSRYGIIAMASSLDSVGHFTHTVEDSRKIFDVTRGEDGFDSTVKNAEFIKPKAKVKLGIPKEYFIKGIDGEVEKSVREAVEVFGKEGVEVVEVSLPHTDSAISVYYIIQPAEVSSNLGRYDGVRFGNDRSFFGEEAARRIMLGTYVLSAGYYDAFYLKAQKVRTKIIQDFENVFRDVDALISPVSPTPAFKIGEKASDPLEMYLADVLTVAGNLAGIPGLAVPSGFNSRGLPLGFQLLGPRFSEPVLFALGKLYQDSVGFEPEPAVK